MKSLPRKRMGAGVIILNQNDELLVVKASYRDYWTLPGGVVDKDESPGQAAAREVEEEIGLKLAIKQLLAVSYNFSNPEWDENLQWIFWGGKLSEQEIENIKVDGEEITAWRFADLKEADKLTQKNMSERMKIFMKALKIGGALYLENWEEI